MSDLPTKRQAYAGIRDWKLARVAPRACAVVAAHAAHRARLAPFAERLPPLVAAFLACRREVEEARGRARAATAAMRGERRALLREVRGWAMALHASTGDFETRALGASPNSVEKVIDDARWVIDAARERRGRPGVPAATTAALLCELSAHVERAERLAADADVTARALHDARRRLWQAKGELQPVLVSLRRVLRRVLGPSHPDYRRLRMWRA